MYPAVNKSKKRKRTPNMKTIMKTVMAGMLALACNSLAHAALTTYTQSYTGVTSVTIAGSTHGLGCSAYTVTPRDSGNVKLPTSYFSYTKDTSTYNVTVTFSGSFTGSVALQGCFSPTSASTDFEPTAPSSYTVNICSSCTTSAYAARSYTLSGSWMKWYVATQSFSVDAINDATVGTARIWLDPVTTSLQVGVSGSSGGVYVVSNQGYVLYNVSAFPALCVPIATVPYNHGVFGTITDNRPW